MQHRHTGSRLCGAGAHDFGGATLRVLSGLGEPLVACRAVSDSQALVAFDIADLQAPAAALSVFKRVFERVISVEVYIAMLGPWHADWQPACHPYPIAPPRTPCFGVLRL